MGVEKVGGQFIFRDRPGWFVRLFTLPFCIPVVYFLRFPMMGLMEGSFSLVATLQLLALAAPFAFIGIGAQFLVSVTVIDLQGKTLEHWTRWAFRWQREKIELRDRSVVTLQGKKRTRDGRYRLSLRSGEVWTLLHPRSWEEGKAIAEDLARTLQIRFKEDP